MRAQRKVCVLGLATFLLVAGGIVVAASPSPSRPPQSLPALKFAPESLDFGRVNPYEGHVRTVQIRNEGPVPVTLKGVQSSCSCTLAALERYTVPPGGAIPLEVRLSLQRYNADAVHTTVTPIPNDATIPVPQLTVSADITPELDVTPAELNLGKVKQGAPVGAELRVRRTGIAKAKLTGFETPPEWTATYKAFDADQYIVRVAPTSGTTQGLHAGRLVLITDVARKPRIEIPIRVEVLGLQCTLTPKVLVFGPSAPGTSIGTLDIRNPEPLVASDITSTSPLVAWEIQSLEQGCHLRINIKISADAPQGKLAGKVSITLTEGPITERREIPFYGTVERTVPAS